MDLDVAENIMIEDAALVTLYLLCMMMELYYSCKLITKKLCLSQ